MNLIGICCHTGWSPERLIAISAQKIKPTGASRMLNLSYMAWQLRKVWRVAKRENRQNSDGGLGLESAATY